MVKDLDVEEVAGALHVSIGLFLRRLRQVRVEGELSLPETAVLKRLERGGPTTVSVLARAEQISVQSMGATVGALEGRGLIGRRRDPGDGRSSVLSVTAAGLRAVGDKRNERTERLAKALSAGFTPSELEQLMAAAPLIERLGQSL